VPGARLGDPPEALEVVALAAPAGAELVIRHYTKRPVGVEAVRWEGNPAVFDQWVEEGGCDVVLAPLPAVTVNTLHGPTEARIGDWIVKGPQGDFWPVRADIFEDSYAQAEDSLHNYSPRLLEALQSLWVGVPYMRFGQVIMNLARTNDGFADTWEWSCDTWIRKIEEGMRTWARR
jgi:hypothetical protein